MSTHDPIHESDYKSRLEYDYPVQGFSLKPVFGEEYIKPLFVIVECWDHRKTGRTGREYKSQFTDQERKKIARWHTHLYTFYLRTGIPISGVQMSMQTYGLLRRAADFFASI
jgi:hypothetical protein